MSSPITSVNRPADPASTWDAFLVARSFYIGEPTEAHRIRVREAYRKFAAAMGLDEVATAEACRRLDRVNGWSQAASDLIGSIA